MVNRYRSLRLKRRKSRAEVLFVAKYSEQFRTLRRNMAVNSERILAETGAVDLKEFMDAGLVTVKTVDSGPRHEPNPTGVLEYLLAISEHLASGLTYPLFDETVSRLLDPAIQGGDLVLLEGTEKRSKRVALAADLLFRLPIVDSLSSRELLAIRSELAAPLLRFRARVIEMARGLESSPWDASFKNEAQDIYDATVVPALLDIGEAVQDTSWLSELVSALGSKALVIPATSAIGMLVARSTEVSSVLIQALAVLAGGGIVANDAIRRWQSARHSYRRNQIFYGSSPLCVGRSSLPARKEPYGSRGKLLPTTRPAPSRRSHRAGGGTEGQISHLTGPFTAPARSRQGPGNPHK